MPGAGAAKGLVLVVEDEKAIADLVRLYLSREGFGVHVEADGRAGLAAARRLHPVAIVLDVGLPSLDGAELCRALRAAGDWTTVLLDPARRKAFVQDTEVALTTTEFDLLAFLMRRPGRVYERDHLLSEVWGYAAAAGTRTVDVHVAQLRSKLGEASPIRTVRGVGYSA